MIIDMSTVVMIIVPANKQSNEVKVPSMHSWKRTLGNFMTIMTLNSKAQFLTISNMSSKTATIPIGEIQIS